MKKIFYTTLLTISLAFSQEWSIPDLKFQLLNGNVTTLYECLKSGPVLIDFWALWCTPCLKSMKYFEEHYQSYQKQGLQVVLINLDNEKSISKVKSYIHTKGYSFQVATDPSQELYRKLNGNAMPYTLLIGSDGKVIYKHIGFTPGDEETLKGELAKLFPPQSPESSPSQ